LTRVLVAYHTFTGNTKKMATAVADGVREVKGVKVMIKKITDVSLEDFVHSDAVAFGAPNTFGGMAGALREFFDRAWSVHEKVQGRPAAAFSSENPGEKGALMEIEKFLDYFKLRKVSDGVVSALAPGAKEVDACKKLGRSLAEAAK
jgi:multimeric flavodoxin WrbA